MSGESLLQYISWLARQDMTQSHQFWRDQLADFNTPLVLVKGNQDDGFYLDDYKLSASLTQNILLPTLFSNDRGATGGGTSNCIQPCYLQTYAITITLDDV